MSMIWITRRAVLMAAAAIMAVPGMTYAAETKVYRIGVSSLGSAAEYMKKWADEIEQHPWVSQGKVKLTVLDAKFDPLTQSNQVDTLITQKIDGIILAPIDFDAGGAAVDKAAAANIPVVGSATRANSDKIAGYVGTDDVQGGRMIAEAISGLLGQKGNVVILEGPIGNSPQILRRKGIDEVLASHPGMKVLAAKPANWNRAEGQTLMENWLLAYSGKVNGVIAENDEMALGAIEAIKSAGLAPDAIKVVGIDGISDGVRAVKDGTLHFTLYKDAHAEGQGALDVLLRRIAGSTYQPQSDIWTKGTSWGTGDEKQFTVPWVPLTRENIESFSN